MSRAQVVRVRRPGRRRSRGQSLVFVALSGVALLAMTGLALDGGYEVGVYRDAQNGSDAGALAAARSIYEEDANSTYLNALNSNAGLCGLTSTYGGSSSQLGVGPQQVVLNNKNATPTCTAKTLTTEAPEGPSGYQSYGALATVDADVSVLGLATLDAHIGLNEASASVTQNPSPAASGSVDLASLSASLTALSNALLTASGAATLYGCSSSDSTAGTSDVVPAAGGSCPGNSLALALELKVLGIPLVNLPNIDTTLGLSGNIDTGPASISLIKQALSSVVPSTGIANQRDYTNVVGASLGILGAVTLNANAGTTSTTTGNLGGDATGSKTDVNVANLSASIAGISIGLNALDASAEVSYDPVNGFQATTSCTLLSGEGSAGVVIDGITLNLSSNCSYTPIDIPGILTVGPTRSVNCQTGTNGEVCSASVCLFDVDVLSALSGVASLNVCLGDAQASATFQPETTTGGVIVTSQIPSPTFFLGVVGAHTTHPEATSAATPRQVTDVSSAAFADAPYALPYDATEQTGGASYCNGSFGPLVAGCTYTVWGSGMDPNSAMEAQLACTSGTECWDGQLSSTSAHAVGSTVTATSGAGTGPTSLISGARYLLLPVINDEGIVTEFGLFAPTSNKYIYTLANTPNPSSSTLAPLAQSETTGAWMPGDEGAVSIKLVEPSYFNASGWS